MQHGLDFCAAFLRIVKSQGLKNLNFVSLFKLPISDFIQHSILVLCCFYITIYIKIDGSSPCIASHVLEINFSLFQSGAHGIRMSNGCSFVLS